MTDDKLDLELATWLAAGPAAFPADNRRAILSAVHELPRERSRLRGSLAPVRRGVVVAAAAIALIAVGALGLSLWRQLVVAPAATPPPSATPAATAAASHTPAFSSPLYGYSVGLPPNWHVTAASQLWQGTFELARTAQYADDFAIDGDPDAALSVKAQELSGGSNGDGWLDHWQATFEPGGHCFGSASPWWKVTAVNVPARHLTWRCDNAADAKANYDVYAFVIGHRGYVIAGTPSMVEKALASFRAP